MHDAMLSLTAHEMELKPHDDSPTEGKLSWTKIFFHGTEQLLDFQKQVVHDVGKTHRRFRFKKLLLVKALNQPPVECPIQVWELRTETGRYAVKLFDEYTDEDARIQLSRISKNHLPSYQPSLDEMKEDADPYLLELRAQEQIDRFCPELLKRFFPKYHGAVELPPRAFPYGSICRRRGIVMDLLQPGPSSWTLFPAEIPESLQQQLEIFEQELIAMPMSDLEKRWYCSLLLDRGRRVTALNALGISHGDIKHDCFGLSQHFHDIALFDFSISYTFMPRKPCLTNVTTRLRTLKRALEVDLRNTLYVTLDLARQRKFQSHIAEIAGLPLSETDKLLHEPLDNYEDNLKMIVLHRPQRPDDLLFPSLSSILPFLEIASPSDSGTWVIKTAQLLGKYVAIWLKLDEPQESESENIMSISVISSEGLEVERFKFSVKDDDSTPNGTDFTPKERDINGRGNSVKSLLVLVPEYWASSVTWEQLCRWTFSTAANSAHQEVWTATREEIGYLG